MGENEKDFEVPERSASEYYRMEIANISGKIEDERFLRRIYISLRDYAKEKGLD